MKTFWNVAALIAYGFVCGVLLTLAFVLGYCFGIYPWSLFT